MAVSPSADYGRYRSDRNFFVPFLKRHRIAIQCYTDFRIVDTTLTIRLEPLWLTITIHKYMPYKNEHNWKLCHLGIFHFPRNFPTCSFESDEIIYATILSLSNLHTFLSQPVHENMYTFLFTRIVSNKTQITQWKMSMSATEGDFCEQPTTTTTTTWWTVDGFVYSRIIRTESFSVCWRQCLYIYI